MYCLLLCLLKSKESFILAHSLRMHSMVVGGLGARETLELEVAGHVSAVTCPWPAHSWLISYFSVWKPSLWMTSPTFRVGLPSLNYSKTLGDSKSSSRLSAKMISPGRSTEEMGGFQRSHRWYVVGTGCLESGVLPLDLHVCDHSHLGRAPGAH